MGKTTVIARVRAAFPEIWLSVSVTTRAPRPGERDGVQYRFVTAEQFDALVAGDGLLEWAEFAGNRYGTPRAPVEEHLQAGDPVLLEIELEGARQIRRSVPDALLVFLEPPSWEVLEQRLGARGTEAPDVVARRLDIARRELAAAGEFDVRLVNGDVEEVCARLVALMSTPGHMRSRYPL